MLGMLQNVMNLICGTAFVNKSAICPLVLQYLSSTYLSLCISCTKVIFYSKSLVVPWNTCCLEIAIAHVLFDYIGVSLACTSLMVSSIC